MRIEKNYRDNEKLRASFNKLAETVFCLNFENWYQNGFWKDNYNPYSIVIEDQVVSNVSVNQCTMMYMGKPYRFIQLGTVMTHPDYRHKGYSRILMEEIEKDFANVDGVFLFANDTVLDFYPKFGFHMHKEYQYSKTVINTGDAIVNKIQMETQEDFAKMVEIINSRKQLGALHMVDNAGLIMFYLSQFMQECVYELPELDAIAVAEIEEDTLVLYDVFMNHEIQLDEVISAFGSEIHKVVLNFTPVDTDGYEKQEINLDDTTLFIKGEKIKDLEGKEWMFPELCHA